MNQNQLYKEIIIFFLCLITNLAAIAHKPNDIEESIKLVISGNERTYYELDNDGLRYNSIGKQFDLGDSIKIGIHTRTIKAPTGKKRRNYGFKVQINDEV